MRRGSRTRKTRTNRCMKTRSRRIARFAETCDPHPARQPFLETSPYRARASPGCRAALSLRERVEIPDNLAYNTTPFLLIALTAYHQGDSTYAGENQN